MIKKTCEIYICEHCRKVYQRERYVERHEKYCKKNPNNKHKCFEYCIHLERDVEENEGDYGGNTYTTSFRCSKTGKNMHSYIAERINHPDIEETDRMPIECEFYEW